MIGKWTTLIVGMAGFMGAASSACGQGLIQQCNGCTDSQYRSLATSLGVGHHLIGDFTNDVINGYHVTREPNGKGYLYGLDDDEVSAQTKEGFGAYRTLVVDHHGSAILVTVPNPRPSGYPVALDGVSATAWAGYTNYQNSMSMWFSNLQQRSVPTDWMSGAASTALLAMQSGVVVNGIDTTITFEIQTIAGAVIRLKWNDGKTKLESVIDQFGNVVPIRDFSGPTNFTGSYLLSDVDPTYSQALMNYLNSLGANIVTNPSQFPEWSICVGAKCSLEPK